jgi:hypothetical protein
LLTAINNENVEPVTLVFEFPGAGGNVLLIWFKNIRKLKNKEKRLTKIAVTGANFFWIFFCFIL